MHCRSYLVADMDIEFVKVHPKVDLVLYAMRIFSKK